MPPHRAAALLVAVASCGGCGLADHPALVLGIDVLAGRRVVIDPFEHRVYLSR